MLTVEQARNWATYDSEKGSLIRRHDGKDLKELSEFFRVNGHYKSSKQLAWMIHYGEYHPPKICSLNGDCKDVRLSNLMASSLHDVDFVLTQDVLKRLFKYNPYTGLFTVVGKIGSTKQIGDVIGYSGNKGYIIIEIFGKNYRAHRLAFLYMNGTMPKTGIDHINQIKYDNRWKNLRIADQSVNCKNQKLRKDNKSGCVGVNKRANKFKASIGVNGKRKHLGSFKTIEEAITARKQAEIKYGFHENHGKPK